MTWPQVAAWLDGAMTGKAWAAVARSMSQSQRLAHLRDFDAAGLDSEAADWVCADLAEGTRTTAMPLEIMDAYRMVPSSRWSWALERALERALAQVPVLRGRTLILVDRGASMASQADGGAAFAAALALRSPSAELVEFGPRVAPVEVGRSVPETVAAFSTPGGAQTVAQAVRERMDGHDRVIVLTHPGAAAQAAEAVAMPGHEHVITEPGDGWFAAIPVIEMARAATWPF
ncbi:hypothetical protein ACFWY5_14975 [Nonomuraea sp. NPDC059007]|uniref:hypothetical protein n=1 Tax=Nonomuraea sp. NPDC059007 TaxID=3346692 RepID=UPI00367C191F